MRRTAKPPANGSLRASVRSSLESYIEQLEGQQPEGLFDMVMSEVEAPMLEVVREASGGNQTRAAKVLGISRKALLRRLDQYKIPRPRKDKPKA